MPVTVTEYVSVPERAAELGCTLPGEMVFLPSNFESVSTGESFLFRGEVSSVAKVLRAANVPVSRLSKDDSDAAYIHNKSHDWALPIIFIGAELMKQSPDMISLALSQIQDYVKDLFKGLTGGKIIKTEIVIEDRRAKTYRKVSYEGDVEGLKALEKTIQRMTRK